MKKNTWWMQGIEMKNLSLWFQFYEKCEDHWRSLFKEFQPFFTSDGYPAC